MLDFVQNARLGTYEISPLALWTALRPTRKVEHLCGPRRLRKSAFRGTIELDSSLITSFFCIIELYHCFHTPWSMYPCRRDPTTQIVYHKEKHQTTSGLLKVPFDLVVVHSSEPGQLSLTIPGGKT